MRTILSLFVVLLFLAACGGSSEDSVPMNSPDFEEIEIPAEFMPDGSGYGPQPDSHLIPEEMVEMFINALTMESARTQLVRRTREASPCGALDDWTDKEIWDDMVDQFNFDHSLHNSGNNLEESIRNLVAHDLPLDSWESDYSRPEWSEFEITHGVAWVVLSEELGRCWDQ